MADNTLISDFSDFNIKRIIRYLIAIFIFIQLSGLVFPVSATTLYNVNTCVGPMYQPTSIGSVQNMRTVLSSACITNSTKDNIKVVFHGNSNVGSTWINTTIARRSVGSNITLPATIVTWNGNPGGSCGINALCSSDSVFIDFDSSSDYIVSIYWIGGNGQATVTSGGIGPTYMTYGGGQPDTSQEVEIGGGGLLVQNRISMVERIDTGVLPTITSWSNSITNNSDLTFNTTSIQPVNFNVTADQNITLWQWAIDDVPQDNNYDNLTGINFTTGNHTVKVNATSDWGISKTLTWTVISLPGGNDPSGYVKSSIGAFLSGIEVVYDSNSVYTDDNGFYDFITLSTASYSYTIHHSFYTDLTGTVNIENGGSMVNYTLTHKCVGICDYYVAKNGSDANAGTDWGIPFFNVTTGVNASQDYGTLHIGYGAYDTQPTFNGSRFLEFFCDLSGYQENVSEPWCDMPLVYDW